MTILALLSRVTVGPIESEIWKWQEPGDAGDQNMKPIQDISGNIDVSKINMLIRLSHGQMQKLLLLFVRGGCK